MSAISLKSITGITSITTPAGVDNVFTVHTNDTTERFRIDQTGNQNIVGIVTVTKDLDVDGHTNLDNVNIAGVTTTGGNLFVNGNIELPDGKALKIWTGGTQGIIFTHGGVFGELDNQTGMMRIKASQIKLSNRYGNLDMLNCNGFGSVDLFHNNILRLTTTGYGVSTTGLEVVGVSTFTGAIDANGDIDVDGHTNLDNVSIAGVSTFTGRIDASDNIAITSGNRLYFGNSDVAFIKGEHGGSGYLALGANNEHMRLTRAGYLLIGTESSRNTRLATNNFVPKIQLEDDVEAAFSMSRFINSAGPPRFVLQKARGTGASPVVVQNNDDIGQILFSGWDGDTFTNGAEIVAEVDGTPGDDQMPGRLIFKTNTGGTVNTERLRITSAGNLQAAGITTSNTGFMFGTDGEHYLYKSAANTATLRVTSNGPYVEFKDVSGDVQLGSSSGTLRLSASGGEKLRITGTGRVNIGDADQNQNVDQLSVTVGASNAIDNVARFQSTAAASGTSESLVKIYKGAGYGGVISGYITQGSDHGLKLYTANNGALSERLRIGSSGQIGIAGANYGSSGQVLTSQGSGSAPTWATPSTSTDPTNGTANNNIWQTVGSNISWHTNYNNTDNTIGSVSNCNQSNVYAIDVKVRIVFNNSGGLYNYNNSHGYIMGYVYQDGKNYFDKGVYTEAQHFDLYYNVFGTVYTIPWDPSGTQNLKIYCTYAYNTSTQNYFNFQVINKWTR